MPEIDFATAPLEDIEGTVRQLREHGRPVVPVRYHGGTAWAILDFPQLAECFQDEERIPCGAAYTRHSGFIHGRTIQMMTGEEHRLNRLLVSAPFLPAAVRARTESLLVPLANALIDRFPYAGAVDLVACYGRPYPFRIISELLGVPAADDGRVRDWVLMLLRHPWQLERAMAARAELDAYLKAIIEERRRAPGADLISTLVTAQVEGRRLDEDEILSFLRLLYPAGADTTANAFSMMMLRVLSDRALYERLLAHPKERAKAVDESLRLDPPVPFLPRYTERGITIGGVDIPAQSWLLFAILAANHDPGQFEDAEVFSLDRPRGSHLSFGRGPHFCLGMHLARAELRTSLDLLLDRLPGLRLAEGAAPKKLGGVLRGVPELPVTFDTLRFVR